MYIKVGNSMDHSSYSFGHAVPRKTLGGGGGGGGGLINNQRKSTNHLLNHG